MWSIEEIKNYLNKNLTSSRYNHVIGVVATAKSLAKQYNCDVNKAEIAALCHDAAKNIDNNELLEIIKKNNINLSIDEVNTKNIWHAIVGPIVAKDVFGIIDEDILNAIRWHTTGRENMSKLEKVVYLADVIEPSRNFDGIDTIREYASKDLDAAMIKALTHTTLYLLQRGAAIDINTVKARNYFLYNSRAIV